jgi:hypothetical protein
LLLNLERREILITGPAGQIAFGLARSLVAENEVCRHAGRLAGIEVRQGVQEPAVPVKVARQQAADVATHQWVDASVHPTRQMRRSQLVIQREVYAG